MPCYTHGYFIPDVLCDASKPMQIVLPLHIVMHTSHDLMAEKTTMLKPCKVLDVIKPYGCVLCHYDAATNLKPSAGALLHCRKYGGYPFPTHLRKQLTTTTH